jgi:hypothetical protein
MAVGRQAGGLLETARVSRPVSDRLATAHTATAAAWCSRP